MATKKVEALSGTAKRFLTIDDSLRAMEETSVHVKALREKFRLYDSSNYRFPHPYFGKLTAPEWLILIGQHEAGHIEQLERIVDSLKKTETFS